MADIDFSQYSYQELKAIKEDLDQVIEAKREEEQQDMLEKIAEMAKALDMSPAELIKGAKKRSTKRKTRKPAKYRNPNNPKQTWDGEGDKPQWFKNLLALGKTPEQLRIKGGRIKAGEEKKKMSEVA